MQERFDEKLDGSSRKSDEQGSGDILVVLACICVFMCPFPWLKISF